MLEQVGAVRLGLRAGRALLTVAGTELQAGPRINDGNQHNITVRISRDTMQLTVDGGEPGRSRHEVLPNQQWGPVRNIS